MKCLVNITFLKKDVSNTTHYNLAKNIYIIQPITTPSSNDIQNFPLFSKLKKTFSIILKTQHLKVQTSIDFLKLMINH